MTDKAAEIKQAIRSIGAVPCKHFSDQDVKRFTEALSSAGLVIWSGQPTEKMNEVLDNLLIHFDDPEGFNRAEWWQRFHKAMLSEGEGG